MKNNINDKKLLKKIKLLSPKVILINLGGGVQEIIGDYLISNLNYKPSIICTGAAISFFTGEQAPINNFFDKLFLGWLIRILFNPKIFLPRYLMSFKLFFLVLRNQVFIK
jgi:UDP-N-acetyl-D-mannosaminuronic acid transferase (WecB/TagA/CpsF family)